MFTHSPNDTRYPFAAWITGAAGAAALGGALFLAGVPTPFVAAAGIALGLFIASSIKHADQWERAVLLRLGHYRGLRGPRYYAIVPVIERVGYHIDQRIRSTAFGAAHSWSCPRDWRTRSTCRSANGTGGRRGDGAAPRRRGG